MSPEMSRLCALIQHTLNLETGGEQMEQLIAAARDAESVEDLPNWARATITYIESQER